MGQKSRWTLPQTVQPDGYRKFVVCVPDEPFYIAAFEGLLIELTYSKNWQRDNAHTAALVSRIWRDVLASATCEQDCPVGIEEMDYDMSICEQLRFHNGHLQGYCCGEWVDITGQPTDGILGPGQPGGGSQQPAPGGGEACYNGALSASQQWLLPTIVNAGDVLSFSDIAGAGTDGTINWFCPDGETFFGGACLGLQFTSGTDPAPALNHMTLVARIGAVYYDIAAGPITVPGGIANAPVTVQVNDSTLSDNSGDYQFKVCVTNNSLVVWSHLLDFRTGTHGAVINPGSGGSYTPGLGFVGTNSGGGTVQRVLLNLPIAAHLTGAEITFSVTDGVFPQTIFITYAGINRTGGTLYTATDSRANGSTVTAVVDTFAFSSVATRSLMLSMDSNTPSQIDTIISLKLLGDGPEPAWS